MNEVIIASKNKGKLKEFSHFFAPFGYSVKSLDDIDPTIEIEETGSTFEENALLKARYIAKEYNVNVLADDSGLEVYALDGAPGVFSARYSGVNSNDELNNKKLLEALKDTPIEDRGARFVCVLAYVTSDLNEIVVEGTSQGVIGVEEKGNKGFGYDPLFYVPHLKKTFAELSADEKEKISHRGKALEKLKYKLFGD